MARFRFDIKGVQLVLVSRTVESKTIACPYANDSVWFRCMGGAKLSFSSLTMLPGLHSSRELQKTGNETIKMAKISNDSIPRRKSYSFGRLSSIFCILLASWLFLFRGTPIEGPSRDYQPVYVPVTPLQHTLDTPQSNHRTEVVQWDQHSLIIQSQRVMLWCVPEYILSSQALVTLAPGLERYIRGGCPFLLSGGMFWRRSRQLE